MGSGTWQTNARRAAPYAVAFLAVLILVLVGYLRGPDPETRPAADAAPPEGSPAPTTPASTSTGRATRPPGTGPVAITPGSSHQAAPATTVPKKGAVTVIDWIRGFGLEGGGDSDMETWVTLLSRGECADLRRSVDAPSGGSAPHTADVFRAASQACLAAFDGRSALWDDADRALRALAVPYAGFDCVNRSVYELTESLIQVHRRHPDTVLRRAGPSGATSLACPRLRSVTPARGPAAGGYEVTLRGEHLPDPAVIHFGEEILSVRTTGGTTAVLTVPPRGDYPGAIIWVEGWPWGPTNAPEFEYEQPAGSPSHAP
ncbi:hypothetical protein KOI35_26740 [Actinoplanes bogorensis]|uniref:IPT/TIG domain-containing protein n=1 Tax=Paractinoplanes bogorensis TaxID=1610840 RepID=A0ABS5YYC7_9ACTN|nr:IPT/TIG domain-containing protein [Actinoplanes bogorensis]MBU2667110.1 hypothetical protein [Actinoplanes bogorensis]